MVDPAKRRARPAAVSDLAARWLDRLRPELAGHASVALENIGRECPAYVSNTMTAPGDLPFRPMDRNPVFHGSFDWHSNGRALARGVRGALVHLTPRASAP